MLTVLPCEFIPTAISTVNSGLSLHVEIYFALLLIPSTSGGLLNNVEKIAVLYQGTVVINHNTLDVVPLADCVGFWLIPDDILGIKRSVLQAYVVNSSNLVTNTLKSTLGRVFGLFSRISASFLTISCVPAAITINTDSCAEAFMFVI